jgi:hypothetical protein
VRTVADPTMAWATASRVRCCMEHDGTDLAGSAAW